MSVLSVRRDPKCIPCRFVPPKVRHPAWVSADDKTRRRIEPCLQTSALLEGKEGKVWWSLYWIAMNSLQCDIDCSWKSLLVSAKETRAAWLSPHVNAEGERNHHQVKTQQDLIRPYQHVSKHYCTINIQKMKHLWSYFQAPKSWTLEKKIVHFWPSQEFLSPGCRLKFNPLPWAYCHPRSPLGRECQHIPLDGALTANSQYCSIISEGNRYLVTNVSIQ